MNQDTRDEQSTQHTLKDTRAHARTHDVARMTRCAFLPSEYNRPAAAANAPPTIIAVVAAIFARVCVCVLRVYVRVAIPQISACSHLSLFITLQFFNMLANVNRPNAFV